jgi:transcriptional regulator with XRE-family HTH domain
MPPLSSLHLLFGEAVRRWRQERGFNQERLAELVGLSTSMIGMIERGEKNTTLESVQRLSDALSVEVRDFFFSSEDDPPSHRHLLFAIAEILKRAPEREIEFLTQFCELFAERLTRSHGDKSSS